MIEKNSGNIYKLELEHNLGVCFLQTVDFTDIAPISGHLIYLYNYFTNRESNYNIEEIEKLNFAMKSICLYKFPTKKDTNIKLIGKTKLIANKVLPAFKDINSIEFYYTRNWNVLDRWFCSNNSSETKFCDYSKIRHLETKYLRTINYLTIKITMYYILKNKLEISNYYNLKEDFYIDIFIDLINTYFTLEETLFLLKKLE